MTESRKTAPSHDASARLGPLARIMARHGVATVLRLSAALCRPVRLGALGAQAMRALGKLAARTRRIRRAQSVAELGTQWQRAFPSPRQVPIVRVTEDTVYAEIHTPCPLRGSGDLRACHRMMAFDREILRAAGGQFVVLDAQARPGVHVCQVAMRRENAATGDLVPAHIRHDRRP